MTPYGWIYFLAASDAPDTMRYFGKTVRPLAERLREHITTAQRGTRIHVSAWIRRVLARGTDVLIRPVEPAWTKEQLNAAEVSWIAGARAVDYPLTNITAGGDGFDSETARKSAVAASVALTPEQRRDRARKGAAAANAALTPEQRIERARRANVTMTPEQRRDRARKGAAAANAATPPAKRQERARKAIAIRWAGHVKGTRPRSRSRNQRTLF